MVLKHWILLNLEKFMSHTGTTIAACSITDVMCECEFSVTAHFTTDSGRKAYPVFWVFALVLFSWGGGQGEQLHTNCR